MALCIQSSTLILNLYFFSLTLHTVLFCICCTSSNGFIIILIVTHVLVCYSIRCPPSHSLIGILIMTHVLVCYSIRCVSSSGLIVILISTLVLVCYSIRCASKSSIYHSFSATPALLPSFALLLSQFHSFKIFFSSLFLLPFMWTLQTKHCYPSIMRVIIS